MSEKGFRIEIPVHIKRDRRARKVITKGGAPEVQQSVPRIARLLALAHKWEGMVRRGEFGGYIEIARLTGLTKGRVTQICCLTLVAPAIQEGILNPSITSETVTPCQLRMLSSLPTWSEQPSAPR